MAKNKNRREVNSPAVTVTEKIPLVSVIIPMYNAANFIPQTLESLLNQTMTDFEVVAVDDCSTDKSVEVVENFAERFGGRLHVVKLAKNTGMPYLPRNVGINFACGKYLAFMDNDDFFTKTALAELTTLAEKFQADVINISRVFNMPDNGEDLNALLASVNQKINALYESGSLNLQKVIELPEDLAKRVQIWVNDGFQRGTWAWFCKRDFWIANQISFPQMPVSDDTIANFACVCLAKKLIIAPNLVYIYRHRAESISREKDDVGNFIHKWVSNLTLGFKALEEIMARINFFNEHPDYRYAVLNWFFKAGISDAKNFPATYARIHSAVLNQFVAKEFSGDDAAFAAYLFNTVNVQQLQIMRLNQELAKFQKH